MTEDTSCYAEYLTTTTNPCQLQSIDYGMEAQPKLGGFIEWIDLDHLCNCVYDRETGNYEQ